MQSGGTRGGPRILALEEPESHLNPKLQRALAERIASIAALPDPPHLLLETHSPHLLTAIQLLVAARSNPLPASRVLMYWTWQDERGESFADEITLDRDARFDGPWPTDAFTDLNELTRQLLNARRGRRL